MEILLLHPGGLGDIILSLPAIALLREAFPAARITLAGNIDHLRPMIGSCVESVISLSTLPLHNLYLDRPVPVSDLKFWRSFDRIISWTGSSDPVFVGNLKRIHPNACVRAWKPGPDESRHAAQLFIDSLGPEIAAGRKAGPVFILLSPELVRQGRQWLASRGWNGRDSFVALHPGAGSKTKQWPLARFLELARHMVAQQNRKVLIIEGPADSGLAEQISNALPGESAVPARSLPLDLLAAVLRSCSLFAGNDSGIAHLAAALEIPSVVIFGPTLPRHWAPLGTHVKVLRNADGCDACASAGSTHTCLERITVEDVMRNLPQSCNFAPQISIH